MPRAVKIVAIAAVVALVVAGVSLFSLYAASQQVPEFYRDAISRDPVSEQEARDRFVAEVTALASDLHRRGRWQRLFTEEAVNAWLALQLTDDYPGLLDERLHDPRIAFGDRVATIACRYESGSISLVLSLSIEAYMQEPNVLALRIRGARAGAVPVPLGQVLDAISHAAADLKLRLAWRKTHGDPVALISFAQVEDSQSPGLALQRVELRDGELYVSGAAGVQEPLATTAPADEVREKASEPADDPQPRLGAAAKETRQE
jgi:hypothetical protein